MLGINIARQEDCSVLTLNNGSSIRLLRNKSINVRGERSNLILLLCTCPTCGDEFWKQFDLRYDELPQVIYDKYMLECNSKCLESKVEKGNKDEV